VTRPTTLNEVPGWLRDTDQRLMRWLLEHQMATGIHGDLVELGVYLGKSAILIGDYVGADSFTVCDLFESPAPDEGVAAEVNRSYANLAREAFEENYLTFHPALPRIIEGPSSTITQHVPSGSCRFVHVDASHHFEHVQADAHAAHRMLSPEGVAVFDDYRSAHTPGVAAAVWDAVLHDGLNPVWLSPNKLYGTWGDPEPLQRSLVVWLETSGNRRYSAEYIGDHRMILINDWPAPSAVPTRPRVAAPAARPPTVRPPRRRPVVIDLLQPMVTRALRRFRG
jgi:predicted O-methyltransferase YrrM